MIRLSWRTELPQWLMIAGMFVLAALSWPWAPDRIPVHWNLAGEVDRFGGKVEGLLAIPLATLGIYVLMIVLPRIDPGRANYPRFEGAYTIIRISLITLMAVLYALVHLWIRGRQVEIATVVPLAVGGLFLLLGGLLSRIKPNWFVGIRTPWTLSSKTAWTRTHQVGGWVFAALGVAVMAAGVFRSAWTFTGMVALLLGGVAFLVVYSYLVWRGAPDKIPPAGSLPSDDG